MLNEDSALYSRLLFDFALVGAAVMSFIMCSDATRARPMTTQVDNGAKPGVLRRLYTPYNQHQPLSTGLLSTETGLQTGTNSDTETQNYREASSIVDYQPISPRFKEGSFSYNQNSPVYRQSQTGITRAGSNLTSHPKHGGQRFETWQPKLHNHPGTGNSYNSYPVILRKSTRKEAASPFHQSSSLLQAWDPIVGQKSYNKEKVPTNGPPKLAEDKTAWQPFDSSLFPSQTGRYWHTSPPTPRGHYSGSKETNVQSISSGISSRRFLGFATAPPAPSISNSLDASDTKSNPRPEKLTSSISDFSKGLHLVSSSQTPRHTEVKSYLFKDSQTSFGGRETVNTVNGNGHSAFSIKPHQQRPSNTQVYSRFPLHFKQSQRTDPSKAGQHLSDNANPLYYNANVALYGAQTDSFTKYPHTIAETLAQLSGHPAPGTDNTMGSFVPASHADFQRSYASGSKKSVESSLVNTTTGGTTRGLYGFRGFKNPMWRAVKEPPILSSSGPNDKANSQRYSFDKGKFKIPNIYPSLSAKYSFGQRKASTLTTTPAKLDMTPTDHSSPSPGTLDTVQTMTTPRLFPPGFKEARSLLPDSDAGMDSNTDHRQFRIYRRLYSLKGFGTRPLEGAKTLVSEADKSARVHQGFEGFNLRSSQIWEPKSSRIQRYWHNKTGETEPGSSHVSSTVSQKELSSEVLKPPLKTAESSQPDTRFKPDTYKNSRKTYNFLGFQPDKTGDAINKTHWTYREQNPTTASESLRISSAYLRSAGDLKVESSPKTEPSTPNKTKAVAMKASLLNGSTISTVRGKRVKGKHTNGKRVDESISLTADAGNVAIVRLPKWYARYKAVMYADILGSASFSGVRATTQTPIALADKGYFPNTTATTKQKEVATPWTLNNTSRSPEVHAEYEGEDFSSVELGVRGEEVDMKISDLLLDDEGSGSGRFIMPDVLSTDTTRSQGPREDLLELDYLRISTGNVSFRSMKLSQTDK